MSGPIISSFMKSGGKSSGGLKLLLSRLLDLCVDAGEIVSSERVDEICEQENERWGLVSGGDLPAGAIHRDIRGGSVSINNYLELF
jgi:hypothetical protein